MRFREGDIVRIAKNERSNYKNRNGKVIKITTLGNVSVRWDGGGRIAYRERKLRLYRRPE